ncbi:MAG: acetolactate synthase isozyme1 large subunit, partial [Rhodobacteraceae bacterium]|nr:acetolactate synthase isozyme1 large subunit [Paracoccaceae bacterium]
MMVTRPLGAQISHMLKDRGVDVIFGIPGVHNIEMYRGIEEAGITHVLARHEQGAGFMADGYARATGRPGVAYVITGPGLCNIMTPMGQAYSDSVPMLVLSSCLDETAFRKGQLHQMKDQEGAAACVCDWSETAHTAEAAYGLVDKAIIEFEVQRQRPKHIQVPIGLLGSDAPAPPKPHHSVARFDQAISGAEAIAGLLTDARKPLLVFGGGAAKGHLIDGIENSPYRTVLRKSRAASFCTYAGRGLVAPDDPLFFGSYLAKDGSAKILTEADLVLFVGTDLAEVDLWREHAGHEARAIVINTDPGVLGATSVAGDGLYNANALYLMNAVAQVLEDGSGDTDWSEDAVTVARTRFRAETDTARPGIVPIVEALAVGLPKDTMYYSDMTQFAYVAKEVWDMDRPGHWHH